MRRVFWATAAVLLLSAAPARGADRSAHDEGASGKSAAEAAREKMEKLRANSRSAARPATPKQKQADADRIAAQRAKTVYMYAVEACDQAVRCDATLRDDAEKSFVNACNVCAPADRCEAERDAIKAGKARRNENPCPPAR